MGVFKISVFILCYFFCRIALSACEPFTQSESSHSLCFDEKNHAWISEKCLTKDCDAKKFLTQYKASKAKAKASVAPFKACQELQIPLVTLTNAKGTSAPYCLFSDGSVLEASVVENLVL